MLRNLKDNPYEALRNNSSSAKALILQSEKVFLKAFARDEIEYYWIFIENTFAPLLSNNDKTRKAFVTILLKLVEDLKVDFLVQVASLLSPYIFNSKEDALDENDLNLIHTEIFTKKNFNFDICQFKEKVKNVFLKDIFSHHKTFNSSKNIEMWKEHFSLLLLDLYAYRNSLVHSGQINEYSRIKLGDVLPKLMSRARWLIINACKENENLNYSDLINKLTK